MTNPISPSSSFTLPPTSLPIKIVIPPNHSKQLAKQSAEFNEAYYTIINSESSSTDEDWSTSEEEKSFSEEDDLINESSVIERCKQIFGNSCFSMRILTEDDGSYSFIGGKPGIEITFPASTKSFKILIQRYQDDEITQVCDLFRELQIKNFVPKYGSWKEELYPRLKYPVVTFEDLSAQGFKLILDVLDPAFLFVDPRVKQLYQQLKAQLDD